MKKLLLLPVFLLNMHPAFADSSDAGIKGQADIIGKEIVNTVFRQLSLQTSINFQSLLDPQGCLYSSSNKLFAGAPFYQANGQSAQTLTLKPLNTLIPMPESISGMVPPSIMDLSTIQLRYDNFTTINELFPFIEQDLKGIQLPTVIHIDRPVGVNMVELTKLEIKITHGDSYANLLKAEFNLNFPLLIDDPLLLTLEYSIKLDDDNEIEKHVIKANLGKFIQKSIQLPTYNYEIDIYPEATRTRTVILSTAPKMKLQETINYLNPASNGYTQSDLITYNTNDEIISLQRTWNKTTLEGESRKSESNYYYFAGDQVNDSTYMYTDYSELTSKTENISIPELINIAATGDMADGSEILHYSASREYPNEEPMPTQSATAIYYEKKDSKNINFIIDVYKEKSENLESRSGIDIEIPANEEEATLILTSAYDSDRDEWNKNSTTYVATNLGTLLDIASTQEIQQKPLLINNNGKTLQIKNSMENYHYTLYNNTGNILQKGDLPPGTSSLPIDHLYKGIYLLQIKNATESFNYKFIR